MLYLPPDPKPGQPVRADTITAILKYLRQITPRTSATCDVQVGAGGATHRPKFPRRTAGLLSNNQIAWPWKVYNTSKGGAGQVQLNGGDGFVASLNGFVCNVNGTPNDTQIGSPPAYPQLSVSGNGVIYGYAVPATPGETTLTSLDLYYAGTLPSTDTANPATYYPFLVATITGFASSGGNTSFQVNNATNTGWAELVYCGGAIDIY